MRESLIISYGNKYINMSKKVFSLLELSVQDVYYDEIFVPGERVNLKFMPEIRGPTVNNFQKMNILNK